MKTCFFYQKSETEIEVTAVPKPFIPYYVEAPLAAVTAAILLLHRWIWVVCLILPGRSSRTPSG